MMYTRADTGGRTRMCVSPPPEQFQGGTVPSPLSIVPRLSNSGGDSKNVPPLSDSGRGQRFFFGIFL